jgi:putative transposase
VARSNVQQRLVRPADWLDHRRIPVTEDESLVAEVQAVVADLPTYGYRRAAAIVARQRRAFGLPPANHKRIYRVMRDNGLLLWRQGQRRRDQRRHDGQVAVAASDMRWCSDGLEFNCDNGEKVRIAFALDCCDREAISWVATTRGIDGDMVQDLMLDALEKRFGRVAQAPKEIEWLTDNGSCYIAYDTVGFAREIGLKPLTTPVSSPQSNGMAESFVKTFKRDYVAIHAKPDARTVLEALPEWFEHYNEYHPHSALKMRSPREFRRLQHAELNEVGCPEI